MNNNWGDNQNEALASGEGLSDAMMAQMIHGTDAQIVPESGQPVLTDVQQQQLMHQQKQNLGRDQPRHQNESMNALNMSQNNLVPSDIVAA